MGVVADWTTAGPYRSLSWLTIAFTIAVLVTLVLTSLELRETWKVYKAVDREQDEGMGILASSTLLRSLGRVGIQIALLCLSASAIYVSVSQDLKHLYWYRVTFIISLLATETLLCISAVNDVYARHKLEEHLKRWRTSDHE